MIGYDGKDDKDYTNCFRVATSSRSSLFVSHLNEFLQGREPFSEPESRSASAKGFSISHWAFQSRPRLREESGRSSRRVNQFSHPRSTLPSPVQPQKGSLFRRPRGPGPTHLPSHHCPPSLIQVALAEKASAAIKAVDGTSYRVGTGPDLFGLP